MARAPEPLRGDSAQPAAEHRPSGTGGQKTPVGFLAPERSDFQLVLKTIDHAHAPFMSVRGERSSPRKSPCLRKVNPGPRPKGQRRAFGLSILGPGSDKGDLAAIALRCANQLRWRR